MNTNQKFPGNGSPVPVLVIIGLGFALVNWLLSDDDTEKKSETAPANAETENRRKKAETPPKNHVFRLSPAQIPVEPDIIPIHSAPAPIFPPAVAPVPKISASAPAPQNAVAQTTPPPIKRKIVTRQDMETIFQRGSRGLTRTAAVEALKSLGFGKTAAYSALSPDGRFSASLQFAPDGMITWKN
jgi:hypothetical protein